MHKYEKRIDCIVIFVVTVVQSTYAHTAKSSFISRAFRMKNLISFDFDVFYNPKRKIRSVLFFSSKIKVPFFPIVQRKRF